MQLEEFLHGGTYMPKVGMCVGCKYRGADCSGLDFAAMPVIKTIDGFKKKYFVICTSYDGKKVKNVSNKTPRR